MILVLDHRDSFTFNISQAFQRLGAETRVLAAGSTRVEELLELSPAGLVLGPGPGPPSEARTALALLEARPTFPILGICLGHQVLGLWRGARIERARSLAHGRATELIHRGAGLFAGLPSPIALTSYNSLVLAPDSIPTCLEITARARDGTPLGIRDRELPYEGIQLHPESILSERGDALLAAFLARAEGP